MMYTNNTTQCTLFSEILLMLPDQIHYIMLTLIAVFGETTSSEMKFSQDKWTIVVFAYLLSTLTISMMLKYLEEETSYTTNY